MSSKLSPLVSRNVLVTTITIGRGSRVGITWEEIIHNRHLSSAKANKDDEGPPLDVLNRDWRNLNDAKHAHRVDEATECLAFGPDSYSDDLGWVEPRDW